MDNLRHDIDWMYKISFNLDRFKQQGRRNVWSCRCPVCGDSKKSQRLARFYFYEKNNNLNTVCHNCQYSSSFFNFVKDVYPQYFDEYKKDWLLSKVKKKNIIKQVAKKPSEKQTTSDKSLVNCTSIMQLAASHKAKRYLKDRCFTEHEMKHLFYSENFKITAEAISHEPLSGEFPDEDRIVIPFYHADGSIKAIQGRSLNSKSSLKYITIKTSEDVDKIYGIERIDKSKTVYCVEGPLDSLFIDNCIATCDASLTKADADVYIWDCQARNEEVIQLMYEAIQSGKSLVIWPFDLDKKIDINDMIKNGLSRHQVMKLIKDNTYSGLTALAKFNIWRKVNFNDKKSSRFR